MVWAGHRAAAGRPVPVGSRGLAASVEDVMLGTRQVAETHLAGCHLVLVSPDLYGNVEMVHRVWKMKVAGRALAGVITVMVWAGHRAAAGRPVPVGSRGLAASVEDVMLGTRQVAETHLAGCHLVLVSPDLYGNVEMVHRLMDQSVSPMVLLEVNTRDTSGLIHKEPTDRSLKEVSLKLAALGSSSKPSCQGLLVDHTDAATSTLSSTGKGKSATTGSRETCKDDVRVVSHQKIAAHINKRVFTGQQQTFQLRAVETVVLQLLYWSKRWLQSETRVVVMGSDPEANSLLDNSALRNTRLALYIAPYASSQGDVVFNFMLQYSRRGTVQIYRRCLYCHGGNAGVQRLYRWDLDGGVPQDLRLFMSNVVTMTYFPYVNYVRVSDAPGTVVRLTDSLNTRMMEALARHLNYSYEVREPEDGLWGLETTGGNWTGTVGTLQHEKADFSMELTITLQRKAVVDFCRAYIGEDMSILSLKPTPLPEYLALFRPFEGTLWVAVVVGTFVWGVALWVLLMIKHDVTERHRLSLASSLFYGWGLLLEDHPYEPPVTIAGQQLLDNGLIIHWMEDVISEHIRQKRQEVEDTSARTSPTRVVVKFDQEEEQAYPSLSQYTLTVLTAVTERWRYMTYPNTCHSTDLAVVTKERSQLT
ncbi:hypothetical protein O3P69_002614 [Scylla paramamosain]|uniref:Ionotropic glutamate receptor L-glutamate and glycine-binding domain-containing protein n=1 Tax=Scylla paramamosain TaxID=85552 RepID=A0AAW0ULB5_SCYPA